MRTTNILLFILVCNSTYAVVNGFIKDRIWFKLMSEFKPVIPLIKQGLGHFFGFKSEEQNGAPN